jgi:hypothetical protein
MTDPEMAPPSFDKAEFDRRRKSRSIVTGFILVGIVALFYFITLARLS